MAEMIRVKFPDGSERQVLQGTTPLEIAKSISPRLAQAALAAKIAPLNGSRRAAHPESPQDGDVIDLTRPLKEDVELRILTEKDPEALPVFRHSSAHLMAAAVLE